MRRSLARAGGLLGAAALMLAAAGCASDDSDKKSSGDQTFHIVVSGGISAEGVLGDNAKTSVMALRASAAAMNEKGGILDRKIEVTVIDDKADPTVAVTELQKILRGDNPPDAYVTSGPSSITAATLPVLTSAKVLSFGIGPTADSFDPEKFPYNFDVTPNGHDFAMGLVPALKDAGYAKVAVIHGTTPAGETFASEVEKNFPAEGLDVVGMEDQDPALLDATPQLSKLKATSPDVLVVNGYGDPVGHVLKGLDKLGWDVPVVGDIAVSGTGLVSTPEPAGLLGEATRNLSYQAFKSAVDDPSNPNAEVDAMVEQMLKLGDIPASLVLATTWDAVPLIAAAAEEAGSLDDVEALAQALEKADVLEKAATVVIPTYGFSAETHTANVQPDAFAVIPATVVEDGRFQAGDQ